MKSNTDERGFLFNVESIGGGGWAWLRLVVITDKDKIEEYNPTIHDNTSHYMGARWRARRCVINGIETFKLIGAFGNPGSSILLTPVE